MELGEKVSPSDFVSEDLHNEHVCPWHNPKPKGPSAVMDPQTPDEDTDVMPKNLGTKLGKNLGNPPRGEVTVEYKQGSTLRFKQGRKMKTVQTYSKEDDCIYCYDLQYAPHHLIPGNESLKGSGVVPFLGDENAIQHFGKTSHIKKGLSANYDVNHAKNGVWLPSPYALSMSNQWPSDDGLEIVKKRKGQRVANETEALRMAYVAAAIEASGNLQFHMRHNDYSRAVRKALDKIGERLKAMMRGTCPIAAKSKENGKIDPPMGLTARLNVLSDNLRRLVTGSVWRPPIFTDKLTQQYAKERLTDTGAKGQVTKVL